MFKESAKKKQPDLDFKIILCAILTLDPYETTFQHLTIPKNWPNSKTNSFELLYSVLNKKTIREFAFIIIKPLLNGITGTTVPKEPDKLLKNYLKKYNYTYNNYFLQGEAIGNQNGTINKLNKDAIRALFFIIGI